MSIAVCLCFLDTIAMIRNDIKNKTDWWHYIMSDELRIKVNGGFISLVSSILCIYLQVAFDPLLTGNYYLIWYIADQVYIYTFQPVIESFSLYEEKYWPMSIYTMVYMLIGHWLKSNDISIWYIVTWFSPIARNISCLVYGRNSGRIGKWRKS